MEEPKSESRAPVKLDWNNLFSYADQVGGDDYDLSQFHVAITVESWHEKHYPKNTQPQPSSSSSSSSSSALRPPPQQPSQGDGNHEIEHLSDRELSENIRRHRLNINSVGRKLPDKGAKLAAKLGQLVAETERRRHRRLNPEANGCEMLSHSEIPKIMGVSNESKEDTPSPKNNPQSLFASRFTRKMAGKNPENSRAVNAVNARCGRKDSSVLARCGHSRTGLKGESSQKGRHRSRISSRSSPFQCPAALSSSMDKRVRLNGDRKGGGPCPSYRGEKLTATFTKRVAAEIQSPHDSRPKKKFVLVDEEEPQLVETTQEAYEKFVLVDEEEAHLVETIQESDELSQCLTARKIYYPSRDDPESVEVHYEDIKCLEPEAYLSSTIMNYYIRYLRQLASPTNETRFDYHIFNTYFYKKLQEAVSNRSDKENLFLKFRRWWKGVNIFQKAYILIPVHENLHWSLVIIIIRGRDGESGPSILHLDSLKLHCSKSIFSNIKSYLEDEWRYLKQEIAPPDVPIAERIWKRLPRRIDEKIITVPQQKNDYDCGLFVLLFMELFIRWAPQRLKSNRSQMFGRDWFKPEQASCLRGKIQRLLIEEFKRATL